MTVTGVIQARTGSTRLPGKVLAEVGGRPMLGFMLDRLHGLAVDDLVVATSEDAADDAVVDIARAAGAAVVRGSAHDVLSRFGKVLESHPAATIVRLTADCPLLDPAIVHDALERHATTAADYTSNTLVREFPDGLDVEVVSAPALVLALEEATDPAEREHVTPFVYRRPERFRLRALRGAVPLGHQRWTVDTAEDLAWVRTVVDRLPHPHVPWQDVLAVAGDRPAAAYPAGLRPASARDADLVPHVADHLEDPAVRSWVLDEGTTGHRRAWASLAVTGGTGRLVVGGPDAPSILAGVVAQLRGEYQVERLYLDAGGDATVADAARTLGFDEQLTLSVSG